MAQTAYAEWTSRSAACWLDHQKFISRVTYWGWRGAIAESSPVGGFHRRRFRRSPPVPKSAAASRRNTTLDTGPLLAHVVREEYTRYVAFHADLYDAEADTLTLWTFHTHAFGAAEAT